MFHSELKFGLVSSRARKFQGGISRLGEILSLLEGFYHHQLPPSQRSYEEL